MPDFFDCLGEGLTLFVLAVMLSPACITLFEFLRPRSEAMRSNLNKRASFLAALLALSVIGGPKQAIASSTEEADLLYRAAVEEIGTVSVEASIEALKSL